MPEQKDSEFTWADYRDRVNNELADVLGNFVNRVLVLTRKYYEGAVPAFSEADLNEADRAVLDALSASLHKSQTSSDATASETPCKPPWALRAWATST